MIEEKLPFDVIEVPCGYLDSSIMEEDCPLNILLPIMCSHYTLTHKCNFLCEGWSVYGNKKNPKSLDKIDICPLCLHPETIISHEEIIRITDNEQCKEWGDLLIDLINSERHRLWGEH